MGLGLGMKTCFTNREAPAPNPDPKRWFIMSAEQFEHAHVLTVKYLDATNFEGIKVMVYLGKFPGLEALGELDPHFAESGYTPIARFRPTPEGIAMARAFAGCLKETT